MISIGLLMKKMHLIKVPVAAVIGYLIGKVNLKVKAASKIYQKCRFYRLVSMVLHRDLLQLGVN